MRRRQQSTSTRRGDRAASACPRWEGICVVAPSAPARPGAPGPYRGHLQADPVPRLRGLPRGHRHGAPQQGHGDEGRRSHLHHAGLPLHYGLRRGLYITIVLLLSLSHFLYQELDKRWKVATETSIKAKSMRGYATYTR